MEWSGINVILPAQYAVQRWYFQSEYDAFLEGVEPREPYLLDTSTVMISPNTDDGARQIVINADVTYASERLLHQSNKDTIDAWAKTISEFAPGSYVRFKRATFGGCPQTAAIRYYYSVG